MFVYVQGAKWKLMTSLEWNQWLWLHCAISMGQTVSTWAHEPDNEVITTCKMYNYCPHPSYNPSPHATTDSGSVGLQGDHTLVQRSTNIFTDFHWKYFHLSCKTSHQTVVSSYITVWLMFTGDILMTASVRTTPSSSPQSSTYYTITLHHTAPQYTMWQYWSSCSSNDALCLCWTFLVMVEMQDTKRMKEGAV